MYSVHEWMNPSYYNTAVWKLIIVGSSEQRSFHFIEFKQFNIIVSVNSAFAEW